MNEAAIEYLVIGGVAVGYYGYPRTTADIDIWVGISPSNGERLAQVFRRFGMNDPDVTPELFQRKGKIIRMGIPPLRIEVLNDIAGVTFEECFAAREVGEIDGERVNLISLRDLRRNKQAAGRNKDLDDLKMLGGPI